MTFESMRELVLAEDWQGIENARGNAVAPHVPALIALYDELDGWSQKLGIIQLLQDQNDTDEVRRVMLDCLRAPDVRDWFQDTVELTKAAALGFVDAEYDTFMAFYNDRERLAETVATVLAENDMQQVAMAPAPAPVDKPAASSLMEAVQRGDLASIQSFINMGADLDEVRDHGHIKGVTPLMFAIMQKQFEAAEYLLDAGADPNFVREGGQTALSWAVLFGERDLANRLIGRGGDVTQRDQWDSTLVKDAAEYGYAELLDDLIEAGAPTNVPISDGRTPLWFAAENGKTKTVMRLHVTGLDVNELITGKAPLHLAVRNNSSRLTTALLKAGADVNLPNEHGRTPLMFAASGGFPNIMKKLLKAGANPALEDAKGNRAIDLASGRRADEIRELLEG